MSETKWTEETITALLASNDRAVERGILAIYDRQTRDEQHAQTTTHSNGVGFSGADASTGTYYAKWLLSGRSLTGTHLAKARKMAIKYRKQLLTIAQSKAQKPTVAPPVAPVVEQVAEEDCTTQQVKCVGECDMCRERRMGTLHHHMGTPVLFTCNICG